MRTVEWYEDRVRMIDQRRLPWELTFQEYDNYADVARAITDMVVRGAPAIGASAAFGMALAAHQFDAQTRPELLRYLEEAATVMKAARPTAVNLAWAVERMMAIARDDSYQRVKDLRKAILRAAKRLADDDVDINRRMALHGAELIQDGDTILHHCNTGALAAVDWGTALGVIRMAHEQGKRIHVLVDETRPRLQGARLTAWELTQYGVPFDIIADNAAGHFMRTGQVDVVMVGSDRTASNGDVANKIGTYKLAVVAKENGIPFYPVVPTSTIDPALASGDEIPIEERDPEEVRAPFGNPIVPSDYPARNPAFDVTPHRYVTGIVTENGVAYPPFTLSLSRAIAGTLQTGPAELAVEEAIYEVYPYEEEFDAEDDEPDVFIASDAPESPEGTQAPLGDVPPPFEEPPLPDVDTPPPADPPSGYNQRSLLDDLDL